MEVEENNTLPCLDVDITRNEDGTQKTSICREAADTDQVLNFRSHHQLHHKLGVLISVLDRKDTIVSDLHDRHPV